MKKREIVRSNILFNEVINEGNQIKNRYYIICFLENNEKINKFGIAVGKKVGNAVTRNKIKRQIRAIIDKNKNFFPIYHNYVVICKKEILNLKFQEMEHELLSLINKGESK